jgi:hypothetical protein
MVLLQLWHCSAALEDQVLKLSAPGFKLVPRNRFSGNGLAIIVFVSQVSLAVRHRAKLVIRHFRNQHFGCEH